MKGLFIFFLLLTNSFSLLPAQANSSPSPSSKSNKQSSPLEMPQLNLSQAMTQSQQQQTGFYRLNSSQKQALQNWIQQYALSLSQQISAQQTKANQPDNQIAAVLGEGHFVKLNSGVVWNISPNAWIYTYYWKAGDTISVSKGQDTLFPYTLTNSNYNQPVNAEKASSQVSKSFSEGYQIKEISGGGQFIRLSNGTLWQVSPSMRYQSAGWSLNQNVFIVQNKVATGGGYELFNGDTSRSVIANVVKNGSALNAENSNSISQAQQKDKTTSDQSQPQAN